MGSSKKTPTLTTVSITYRSITANLDMLPDTGADITVIGRGHLEMLQIPSSSLRPPPSTTTLTADGSSMAPALGTFQARFSIGKRSCTATVQVYEDVQTPLLSYGHCQATGIVTYKARKGSGKELNQDGEDEAMTTECGEVNRHNGEFDDMTITTEDLGAVVTRGQRRNERRSRISLKVSDAGTGPLKNRKVMKEYRVSCVAIRMGKVKVS
ncbi:hypothetical protein Pcinc_002892 [Petrolisthes cinctipes]|uniref:Peptidase A2 domain-containing protein n=1 Tax=Petrolisthes cinctipes TaxID=88211 RepID=A0AAE1GHF1_PETCI|nr:hypothetical protein Pcinc_002892 [Petrolisthes cinctipes]